MRRPVPPPRGGRGSVRGHGHIHIGFIAPDMNFEMVGFDLGMGGGGGPAPPPPTYDPPEAAPDGFTRSPNENDPLVCPNCEEELCVGETEQKRQVWIVKGCGHVRTLLLYRVDAHANGDTGVLWGMHGESIH